MISTLVHDASFYPSLMQTLKVKVLGKKSGMVQATHDHGTANHEIRHMIDAAFLQVLEGADLEITSPQPPCTKVELTKTPGGDHVQGMLKEALPVYFKCGPTDDAYRVVMYLDHVLVVDSLPVPIHISLKALENKEGDSIYEWLGPALHADRYSSLNKSMFPPSYHSHAYWKDDGTHCCGSCVWAGDTEFSRLASDLERHQGVDMVMRRVCAMCKSFTTLSVCKACKKEWYCSKECQVADWPRHKPLCTKKPRKARPTKADEDSHAVTMAELCESQEGEPELVNEWLDGLNLGTATGSPRAVSAQSGKRKSKGKKR